MCSSFLAQQEFLRFLPVLSFWKGQNSIRCCDFENSSVQAESFLVCVLFLVLCIFHHMYTCETVLTNRAGRGKKIKLGSCSDTEHWTISGHPWESSHKVWVYPELQLIEPFFLLCTIKCKWQFRKCVITSSTRGEMIPEILLLLISSGRNELNWTGTII